MRLLACHSFEKQRIDEIFCVEIVAGPGITYGSFYPGAQMKLQAKARNIVCVSWQFTLVRYNEDTYST